MTITEAAACGTVAVATRIAGHSDAIVDGRTGLLVDNTAGLAPQQWYSSQTGPLVIPKHLHGTMYLIVEADSSSSVNEFPKEGNNNSPARAITVTSVTIRAVASCQSLRRPPRESQGATRAREEWRRRLTLPACPAVKTPSHTVLAT